MKALYLVSLILGNIFIIIGSMFKIMHWPGAMIIMFPGFPLCAIYTFIGLIDSYKDPKQSYLIKGLWLLSFLFLNGIAGLFYYIAFYSNKRKEYPLED